MCVHVHNLRVENAVQYVTIQIFRAVVKLLAHTHIDRYVRVEVVIHHQRMLASIPEEKYVKYVLFRFFQL
jgi:hypothetical protein